MRVTYEDVLNAPENKVAQILVVRALALSD